MSRDGMSVTGNPVGVVRAALASGDSSILEIALRTQLDPELIRAILREIEHHERITILSTQQDASCMSCTTSKTGSCRTCPIAHGQ